MGEFSPVQLDALEDALEDLELAGIPGDLEGDPAVAGRLGDYRELLTLSREALPSVEVPAGILDGVLAAAREDAAAAVPEREAEADAAAKPWWARVSLWVPMLAVGASAALVLIVVRGTVFGEAEPSATVAAKTERADDAAPPQERRDGLLDDADALQAVAEPASVSDDGLGIEGLQQRGRLRGSAALGGDAGAPQEDDAESAAAFAKSDDSKPADAPAQPRPEPEAEPKPEAEPEPTDKVVYDEAAKGGVTPKPKRGKAKPAPKEPPSSGGKKSSPKPESKAAGGAPGGAPQPAKDADPLASAERNRQKGRCGSARAAYRSHLDDADDSVRARALAGMGLCALAGGDEDAANGFFERAKSADGSVAGFIAAERAKLSPKSEAPKNTTKKK
ncbi:MAG: hypothetical protein ACE37F_18090 [Nannocystaceae bacterium]|nr:hypothetical protein [bacterium]